MAHTDAYTFSYYYGQKYNTTGYNDLLRILDDNQIILFDNRVSLVGRVFYIMYDVHIDEFCCSLIEDAVGQYHTYKPIPSDKLADFSTIKEHLPSVMKLNSILTCHLKDNDRIALATQLNSLVFEYDEISFYEEVMKLLNIHTTFNKFDNIGEAVYDYWAKIKEHVKSLESPAELESKGFY